MNINNKTTTSLAKYLHHIRTYFYIIIFYYISGLWSFWNFLLFIYLADTWGNTPDFPDSISTANPTTAIYFALFATFSWVSPKSLRLTFVY